MKHRTADRLKHAIIALCFIAICAFLSFAAHAGTASTGLSYVPPTQYEDGSQLKASDITGYQVDCTFKATGASSSSACSMTGSPLPGGTSTSGTVVLTYPVIGGQACFVLHTLVGSNASVGAQPPVCKDLPAVKPKDPTNLTITVTLTLNVSSDTPIRVAVNEPVISQERKP